MKTDEEILREYVGKMGRELGELFHAISNELTTINWRWNQYRILFGEKPSRLDLLNESAPFFFQVVQNALMEDTLLGIARLVGPIKSVGRSNVSIGHLPPLISDHKQKNETEHLVENAKSLGKFAVDWRHRYIAHQDLELALGRSATPLAEVTRERIEKALSALSKVLNYVAVAFGSSETAYSAGVALGDAQELLYVIRDGLTHRSASEERLRRGEPNSDDLKPREKI
jgi:hypothetical protein